MQNNVNFDLDVLKHGIELLIRLKKLIPFVNAKYKHHVRRVELTFQRVIEDYFFGHRGSGDLVTIEGFLSKYILTYRQDFYTPFCHRVIGHTNEPTNNFNPQRKVKLQISNNATQFPIQVIPPFESNGTSTFVYFLYPPEHNSFLLKVDDEQFQKLNKKLEIETLLSIKESVKPIFVISSKELVDHSEKIVKLTGRLTDIDENIINSFTDNMSCTQQQLLSNCIRPFSERNRSLCLDLRDTHEITVIEDKKNMHGLLYLESHVEDLDKIQNYPKIIGESFPGALPGLNWFSMNSQISYGLTESEVFVASNQFTKFAFYIEANLCDQRNYESSLRKLHEFTQVFRKNLQNHVRKAHNKELKMQYDFLFDYRKAKLFHPDGVLVSKEVVSILKEHPKVSDEVDWLRRASSIKN